MSLRALSTVTVTSVWTSSMISSTGCPPIPPAALISSTAIWALRAMLVP
jgi:hypothetical protein